MRTVLILLLASAVALPAAAAEPASPTEDERKALDALFLQGVNAVKASEWDEAMAKFNEVLQADPDHGGALNYRAKVHIVRKEFDKAMADIDHAIELEPEEYRFASTKGLIYEHLGEAQKAIEWYSKALDLHGFDSGSLKGRIALYMSLGEYEQALADCDWLLKHQETTSNKLRRARALFKLGEREEARKYLDELIKEEKTGRACQARAEVLLELGETEAAYWDLVAASRLNSAEAKPILALGDFFLFHAPDLRQAVSYYTAAIKEYSDPPVARLRRGMAFAALEPPLFFPRALEDFSAYIKVKPDDPEGYAERAKLYLSMDERAKALADIRKALELDPDNETYTKTLKAITAGGNGAGRDDETESSDSEEEVQ